MSEMYRKTKEYLLSGVFDSDGFSITVPVHVVVEANPKKIKDIGDKSKYGEIYYDVKSRNLFHDLDGNITFITKHNENVHCEILKLRQNFDHETLLGLPIFEQEDYEQLSFSDWENKLFAYCEEEGIEQYYFNSIGYRHDIFFSSCLNKVDKK